MTRALLIGGAVASVPLVRAPLGAGHDERWLQQLLFAHPELLPIEDIDPGAGQVIPLCRELALPGASALVYLDMLGVTPRGRLVLVECKLWRNPQARREVVAQILEYAALLRRWTFSDLTAKLKAALRSTAQNPIFEAVRARVADVDEARLTDGVSRSLAQGAFDLLVAGDGIRSDLAAIAAHLNDRAGLTSRLALVEMQLWQGPAGETLVVPHLPFRTEVIEHRVVVDQRGAPLPVVSTPEDAEEDLSSLDQHQGQRRDPSLTAASRAFWQRFIDSVRFDHPDQGPARHGTHNTVRMDLPAPGRWLTGYRVGQDRFGLFARLRDAEGKAAYEALAEQLPAMRQETGLDLRMGVERSEPFVGDLYVTLSQSEVDGEDAQLAWLFDAANRLTTALRPRLVSLAEQG